MRTTPTPRTANNINDRNQDGSGLWAADMAATTGAAEDELAGTGSGLITVDPARPLAGKVAVVTGAGRGIGRSIALELGRRGATVVVNYGHSQGPAQDVVAELAALGSGDSWAAQADVRRPDAVAALFDAAERRHGHVDLVISNAGAEAWSAEAETPAGLWDAVFALNCRGQFLVAQQGLRRCRRGGRIVLTSSVAATMAGLPGHALYAGSKAAVEAFARCFAAAAGPRGVTVNAIAPGGVKGAMYDANAWHYAPGGRPDMPLEDIDRRLAELCPLGRVGSPEDIGRAVAMLCLPESEWINGEFFLSFHLIGVSPCAALLWLLCYSLSLSLCVCVCVYVCVFCPFADAGENNPRPVSGQVIKLTGGSVA